MAVVTRATANQAMIVLASLIACASFVNADTCDLSMMQVVAKDTTDAVNWEEVMEGEDKPMEAMSKKERYVKAKKEAHAQAKKAAKEQANAKAKKEAEEAEEKAKKEAEAKAKKEAHFKAKKEAAAKAKKEVAAKAQKEVEDKAKQEAVAEEPGTGVSGQAGVKQACAPGLRASTSDPDPGVEDGHRGWYDVQGCGQCLDYCRWVGVSGSGGDPAKHTEQGGSYWSCSLAGSGDPYTAKGHFGSTFLHKQCSGVLPSGGQGVTKNMTEIHTSPGCAPGLRASTSDPDHGYEDSYRGWYDAQGCGQCLDFCRWVGASGSGGDPAKHTEQGGSHWSCHLAGSSDPYTDKGHFGSTFLQKQCVSVGRASTGKALE